MLEVVFLIPNQILLVVGFQDDNRLWNRKRLLQDLTGLLENEELLSLQRDFELELIARKSGLFSRRNEDKIQRVYLQREISTSNETFQTGERKVRYEKMHNYFTKRNITEYFW